MSKREKGEEDPGGSDVPSKKVKPVGGNRCVIYGCSNTMYDGYAIHELPKQGSVTSVRRAWINFIQLKLKGFNANERAHVYVCSGHFTREQYDPSQVMQYRYGLRKVTPRLLPNAIPRLQQAVQPFPGDWFLKQPPSNPPLSTPTTPTTVTITVASCRSLSSTKTVHSTNMAVTFMHSQKPSASKAVQDQDQPITFADASTCMSPTQPSSSGSKRRVSLLRLRKKVCV